MFLEFAGQQLFGGQHDPIESLLVDEPAQPLGDPLAGDVDHLVAPALEVPVAVLAFVGRQPVGLERALRNIAQ